MFVLSCLHLWCTAVVLSSQVNLDTDVFNLATRNESVLALAEEYCGPVTTGNSSCNLRTAFFYASSLVGNEVDIWVNVGRDLVLEQRSAVQVSG